MKVEAKVNMEYQKIFSTEFIQRFNLIKNERGLQRTRIISFNDPQTTPRKHFYSMIFVRNEGKINRKIVSTNSDYIYAFLDPKTLL